MNPPHAYPTLEEFLADPKTLSDKLEQQLMLLRACRRTLLNVHPREALPETIYVSPRCEMPRYKFIDLLKVTCASET